MVGTRVGTGQLPKGRAKQREPKSVMKNLEGDIVQVSSLLGGVRPKWAEELTDREWMWVNAYVSTLSAAQASKIAGLVHLSTNAKFREVPHMAAAVDKALATASGPARTALFNELVTMALHQPKDYMSYDADGSLKLTPSDQLTDEQMLSVKKVKRTKGKNPSLEFELVDKGAMIEKAGKVIGLFNTDKSGGGGSVNVQIVFSDNDKRLL